MQITSGKVVTMDYKLTNDSQETLDSSEGGEPLAFIYGAGQIIPGLEKALEGKAAGDAMQVRVEAAEAYGERDEAMVVTVPRGQIDGDGELREGTQLRAAGPQGERIVTVTAVRDDEVVIDGNHPLAGQDLNFDVTVREVREATEEEVAHGHVHGPGGHHHH